jgi:hypothetical protein
MRFLFRYPRHATTYLLAHSPRNFKAAVDGLLAGMKGGNRHAKVPRLNRE